jgi:DNA-binding SARP family transcriptional activator/tetratricopeptide (TPR) repeat protein
MRFQILGPVELWHAGEKHSPGPDKIRCLLSILLLNLGSVVSDEILIERLWDTAPPAKAQESLSVYVTRLRGVLRRLGGDGMLQRRAHGYSLDADRDDVDIHRFRELWRQAQVLSGHAERERAIALLREADALWRGPALTGLPGNSIARVRRSLEEERRAAILARIDLESALGRHAGLVIELEQLSDLYPMDEAFIAHQMNALYQSGRPADALSVYRAARARLISELGTEPGPELADLHQRMLRGEITRHATLPADRGDRARSPDTLPAGPRVFLGRAEELEALSAGPDDAASVWAVTGMPGAGKTTLAVAAARAMRVTYPDGQLFASFRTHDVRNPPADPAGVLLGLLTALGASAENVPPDPAQRAVLWQAELTRRRLIVVLDDIPELDAVRQLLPAEASGSRVILTARSRLEGVDPARTIVLGPLPAEDAAELFARIAGPAAARPPAEIAKAARLCGRLPLAISVVASGLRHGGETALDELIDDLSRPPASLRSTVLPSPEIAVAFDHSYRRLDTRTRRLFRRLGLHPGTDITVHAARALDGGPLDEVCGGLEALADQHLLERGDRCFRFHDLMRQFAGVCAARDETESERWLAFGRLLDFYLAAADRADRLLYPNARRDRPPVVSAPPEDHAADPVARAADWLNTEWRNILSAARRAGEHERQRYCVDLALALVGFLENSGHWSEAVDAYALALQMSRDLGDVPEVARTSLALSVVTSKTGHTRDALRHADEAAAIYRTLADQRGEADALDQTGIINRMSGRFREALAYHRAAAELYRVARDQQGVAGTLSHIGSALSHLGRVSEAVEHLRAALDGYERVGDRRGAAGVLTGLGKLWFNQGLYRDALGASEKALEIFTEMGVQQGQAIVHQNIGCIHYGRQDYDQALISFRRANGMCRQLGDLWGVIAVLNDTGVTYQALSYFDEALASHQPAKVLAEQLGDSLGQVIALRGIADAVRRQGHHDQAIDRYQEALRLAHEIGERYEEGKILEGMAEAVQQTKGSDAARIFLHQALDALEPLGVPEVEPIRMRLGLPSPGTPDSVGDVDRAV